MAVVAAVVRFGAPSSEGAAHPVSENAMTAAVAPGASFALRANSALGRWDGETR